MCVSVKADKDIIETAIKAASVINIPFCGVDIIKHHNKNYVIELNSIPAWKGMQTTLENNISDEIINIFIGNSKNKSLLSVLK